jgi:hypothetical protein
MRYLLRQAMAKPVQLDREPGHGAIKIQPVGAEGMLAPEFEAGKPPCSQCTPELRFFSGLFSSKSAQVGRGIHGANTVPVGGSKVKVKGLLSMNCCKI